ncbi:MAG: aminoacyl-tRNA hydrolase [Saccharospirillaceae bacterium]|nr:aminoacyl-tRNA hydrolase [Saccharospirillaceae bacterium]MCD8530337.1 aminoacyl-tRNA hydrolase [Saccharospirillaceae bacterium]
MNDLTDPLFISHSVSIPWSDIDMSAIRAQGAGGQNVNKVSSAIHLRFNVQASSLPEFYQEKLLALRDQRITQDGVIIIKAQQYRTQEQNRQDALARLQQLIQSVSQVQAKRIATRPTRSAKKKRVDSKTRRGAIKNMRGKVKDF